MTVSHTQNFTKIASEWDSGTYTCLAGIGKVVKKSSVVQIAVCGECILAGSDSTGAEWEEGDLSPAAIMSSRQADYTAAG